MKVAIALIASWMTLSMGAGAQPAKILTGKDLTESALIDALTPEERVRSRSIKVERDPTAASAKTAAASLLITFATNSAELTPRARSSLDVVGRALNSDKLAEFRFVVEGHADPRGGHELNLRLSQARAGSVVDYLAHSHGVGRERLKALGKGDQELLNAANPEAPENRRVTIKTVTD